MIVPSLVNNYFGNFRRYALKAFAGLLTGLIFLTAGCGGGGSENKIGDQTLLFTSLFGQSTADIRYYKKEDSIPDGEIVSAAFESLGLSLINYDINQIRINYRNTNFPQRAIHISNKTNRRLLIYNHGHGGLPNGGEGFANNLLQGAMDLGFDILLTSMPLVGLNTINPHVQYWAKVYGSNQPAFFDPALLTPWVHFHAAYEIIDDPDHYLHFFIDSAVIFSALTSESSRVEKINLLSDVNNINAYYESISYVGLSGGATTGLTACAIFRFDKCILVAGFLPFYLRAKNINSWGDAEQISKSFYSQFPYEKLMEIAGRTTKKMVYIYNSADPCCFSDPEATKFKNDFFNYDIRIVESNQHAFDSSYVLRELTAR